MSIYPSGFKLPEGQEYKIEDLGGGLYVVANAYEGQYEYFEGRPIEVPKCSKDA